MLLVSVCFLNACVDSGLKHKVLELVPLGVVRKLLHALCASRLACLAATSPAPR